jgi:hypothetical protein
VTPVATRSDLARQLAEARQAVLAQLRDPPGQWWTATDLREAVQNGWPSTVVSVAIQDLVASSAVELNDRLQLRLVPELG